MDTIDGYEPERLEMQRLWEGFPLVSRQERFAVAVKREAACKVLAARKPGESERKAALGLQETASRTSLRRWSKRRTKCGFDGLVDWRRAPGTSRISPQVQTAICTLRRADPNVCVAVIVKHVAEYHHFKTSDRTVNRVLHKEGLARRRGPVDRAGRGGEQHLEYGGMKLVEAALVETGYLQALSVAVGKQVAAVPTPNPTKTTDCSDRDEYGRFLPIYNERFRKRDGDAIGPGFASVETKRVDMDPNRLHVSRARYPTIERKMFALMTSPLLGGGRSDGLRTVRGALLEELCGFGYMPSTLDLLSRELKYIGVSSTLWEVHARLWLEKTAKWGSKRNGAVLFIDGTSKPVWTGLFSQSSKVSSVGRVMPSLESVFFHSGHGVPLWMKSHSGRMPLIKAVPDMLKEFREFNNGAERVDVAILDAEINSVPFFKTLEQEPQELAWITRFKPSLVANKPILEQTKYRTYRDGDRIRMGVMYLNDPETKTPTFRVRVVEVERRSKGTVTYLGASTLLQERDWNAEQIADLYFARWPNQEGNFRAVNQAVELKDVHGYGKQLVDNVPVITELTKLDTKSRQAQEQIEQHTVELEQQLAAQHEQRKLLGRFKRRHETRTRQLHARLGATQRITAKLRQLETERTAASKQVRKQALAVARSEKNTAKLKAKLERQREQLKQHQARQATLESRRHILQHDVELDAIFGVLKVGLVLTIMFVLKEYLGDACMEAITFLQRVATLHARLRILPDFEVLTFEYNQRDPDVMALLTKHCDAINARALRTRSGRTLLVRVDPAPPPKRPPTGRRTKRLERFHPKVAEAPD